MFAEVFRLERLQVQSCINVFGNHTLLLACFLTGNSKHMRLRSISQQQGYYILIVVKLAMAVSKTACRHQHTDISTEN